MLSHGSFPLYSWGEGRSFADPPPTATNVPEYLGRRLCETARKGGLRAPTSSKQKDKGSVTMDQTCKWVVGGEEMDALGLLSRQQRARRQGLQDQLEIRIPQGTVHFKRAGRKGFRDDILKEWLQLTKKRTESLLGEASGRNAVCLPWFSSSSLPNT